MIEEKNSHIKSKKEMAEEKRLEKEKIDFIKK